MFTMSQIFEKNGHVIYNSIAHSTETVVTYARAVTLWRMNSHVHVQHILVRIIRTAYIFHVIRQTSTPIVDCDH